MPQMMPIYWFLIFLMVNLFVHFFFSFYHFDYIIFKSFSFVGMKKEVGFSFLK